MDKKYMSIAEIAAKTGKKHDALYHFIQKHNREHPNERIERYKFPISGNTIYLEMKDADMLIELFEHPEQFAQKVG